MLKPDINFDLNFPRLNPTLKNYTENQLRILRQDQNELNKQVFGLIVIGTFLPTNSGLSQSQLSSGSINTALETAGSMLSSIFNKFLKEYITGLDIEIGANVFDDYTNASGKRGQAYRLRGNYEINDRVTISGGLGVETGDLVASQSSGNVFIGGDVLVDYYITQDRRLKLRLSSTYDQTFEGQRLKPAIGIRYRQEFDSVDEFFKSLKIKKVKTEGVE